MVDRPPLTVTHIDSPRTESLYFPEVDEYPGWVVDLFSSDEPYVAVYCSKSSTPGYKDFEKAKNSSEILAKSSLIKKINSSELVYSKEELSGESYGVQVKSRSSGYLPRTDVLRMESFNYNGELNVCSAVGFSSAF